MVTIFAEVGLWTGEPVVVGEAMSGGRPAAVGLLFDGVLVRENCSGLEALLHRC